MTETSTKTYQELEQDLENVKETLDTVLNNIREGDSGRVEIDLEELLERIT